MILRKWLGLSRIYSTHVYFKKIKGFVNGNKNCRNQFYEVNRCALLQLSTNAHVILCSQYSSTIFQEFFLHIKGDQMTQIILWD